MSVFEETCRELSGSLRKDHFFVCGVVKSGTTWIERILDAHPELLCKGEAHFGSEMFKNLSKYLTEYNELVSNKGGAIAHLKKYGGHTDALSYDQQDLEFLSQALIALMYRKWDTVPGVKAIGEKTPDNLDHIGLLNTLLPESRFVHIIRDARDVAVSLWFFNMKTDVGKTIQAWGSFNNFAKEFASLWVKRINAGRKQGAALGGDRYIEIRYEDLLLEPESTVRSVCEFLEVSSERSVLEDCIESVKFEKLSGGRKSGEEDVNSFYRKGVSGDWKNHFDSKSETWFNSVAGELLLELGYEL